MHRVFLVALLYLLSSTSAIWPQPTHYQNGSQILWLSCTVEADYKSRSVPVTAKSLESNYRRDAPRVNQSSTFPNDILTAAFDRFMWNAMNSTFVPWKFFPRGTGSPIPQPVTNVTTLIRQCIQHITIEETTTNLSSSTTSIDESYSLSISANGSVWISVASTNGAIYALNTLSQLFYATPDGSIYTPYVPVYIQDSPVFEHRGLNLDISRNYISPHHVMRTINAMSFNKLNRLHLHATDSQSWPLEIPALADLAAKGAYRNSSIWSVADLEQVQSHGTSRGVQVFLEIDSPGHTAAIAYAYPDLIAAFNEQPWVSYGNEPPTGQLKLNDSCVTTFMNTLYGDLLPRVSPYSDYFHTGGDELNANVYSLDPSIKSNSSDIIQPYFQSFINHIHSLIRAQGLTPIVWEETLLIWNISLPTNSTIIQTWKTSSVAEIVAQGYQVIFGDSAHWYLDCGYGAFIDPSPKNPQTPIVPPYLDWCSPMNNWRQIYSYDPRVNISTSDQKLLLGGEIQIWGELTDPVNLDGKIWPRAAAAAEVLWSGPTGPEGVNEGVTRRLAEMRERLVDLGFAASMVQMEWCLQNQGGCTQ
ncbi:N-acetyl-glucosamine-6-phosphate deacetylase [Xylographa soralifera]|nr:N-acetyl-glucosamine-6-phosphate deacetylase [Xylographa soralifera]